MGGSIVLEDALALDIQLDKKCPRLVYVDCSWRGLELESGAVSVSEEEDGTAVLQRAKDNKGEFDKRVLDVSVCALCCASLSPRFCCRS